MSVIYGWRLASAVGLAAALAGTAFGRGVFDSVGYTELLARLGLPNIPTGAGVVVGQVESPFTPGGYGPNPADPEFAGKTFTAQSGPPGNSDHATAVGWHYFGNTISMAHDVSNIYLYESNNWATTGYLRTGQASSVPPVATPGGIKCFNNSWIASFGSPALDNECLRRADFAADRDELLIINGMNNGPPIVSLMSVMFNGISVGVEQGTHAAGTTPGSYDGPGRMKPEMVSPGGLTSFATPIVSAAAALLVETANTGAGLSGNVNARRSETLKAVLLAGASHRPTWTNLPATSGPTRGETSTPLDAVFGVDMVNVDRSHMILTGLEQNGSASVPAAVNAMHRGWDLATFNGASSRYYRFHVGALANPVSILATWHRIIPSNNMNSWSMANFTLTLWRVDSNNQLVTLVGNPGLAYFLGGNVVSQSTFDNIEHLYIINLQPGDYAIQLARVDGLGGSRDAAIAWLLPKRLGDVNGDGFVNIDDLLQVINNWGACPPPCLPACPADLNGDCLVNVTDLLLVINNW